MNDLNSKIGDLHNLAELAAGLTIDGDPGPL